MTTHQLKKESVQLDLLEHNKRKFNDFGESFNLGIFLLMSCVEINRGNLLFFELLNVS